ncbi:discoidin domain-containing protein [candidate division KSB1 bacterium]|nr:discoidin domain-containing protein [candidate division KSB1 bacterium]
MRFKFLLAIPHLFYFYSSVEAQTVWTKHSGNPVIPAQNRYSAEPAVIYDSFEGRYKMWYSTSRDGFTQIYYATSDNGLNWTNYPDNPVLRPGEVGAWDGFHVRSSAVVFTNGLYRLYYIGSGNSGVQIGLATSEDGITWQKYEGNPVIKRGAAGTWDSHTVYHPKVVFDGSKFMMWYAGSDGAYVKGGLATSTDGVVWNKYSNNPVLLPGVAGSWDEYNVWPSSGVVFKDGIFHLLYTGVNFANPSNSPIGLAISADGITWEKSGVNPVLQSGPVGSWDHEGLGNGSLHFDGNRFRLWYSAHDASDSWHIGYAESTTEDAQNYALDFDGSDDLVKLPPNFLTTPEEMTLEAWVKTSSEKPLMLVISLEGAYGLYLNRFAVGSCTPFFDGGTIHDNDFGYGKNLNDDRWHHIAATHAGGELRVFIDGVFAGATSESLYDITTLDRAAGIGGQFDGSEYMFDGIIDEVRIWNIAKTQTQIQANMHTSLQGNEPGLVGYWRFDEGEGQAVHDASPFGNHGQRGHSPGADAADPVWVLANRNNGDGPCGIPLPAAAAYGNLPGGDQTHADKVDYCFEGQPGALYLTFEAYDIDLQTEVKVRLNGESIFDLPITSNNAWSGLTGVLLPDELINDSGPNELSFDNLKNPPKNWRWGVRQVSVDRFYALPSTAALGRIHGGDQSHSDKVVYFFSGQPGDLDLTYAVYDIDNIHEIDILLNGVKIHDEAVTANEAWSAQRTLLLPDGLVNDTGINVLIFNNTKNPPKNWLWGVRNVSVSLAQAATLALNLPQGLSFSGVALQHASNLFDGQTRPPARPEDDDDGAADSTLAGVATIGPEGYLIVDYAAPQQFDAVMIYPEWNAQRYFRYRIEASLDGQNWQTLIDRTAVATQGAQFVPLPQTLARFMRIRGASCVIDEESLPAGVNEQEYWQAHDALIENAAPRELALAELALLRREKILHVDAHTEALPAGFRLAQNYPNPFNPATTIRFNLPQREQVKLAVYNTMGELVQILAEGSLPAGTHIFTFEAAGLASGVYLYRLQAGAFRETRKLLLMR